MKRITARTKNSFYFYVIFRPTFELLNIQAYITTFWGNYFVLPSATKQRK